MAGLGQVGANAVIRDLPSRLRLPQTVALARTCRLLGVLVILTAAALRLAYLTADCPLDLAPDEAHYWDWSRRLDWSFYSKGPLVAWLIRASCALFGETMPSVRLPAVLCGSLLLASLYVLTVQVFRREELALSVVAGALTLPVISAGSSLVTIDAPYACCWGWALVLGHRAMLGRSSWAWPVLGLVIGLGILAKYTMLLWVVSAGLFLFATPSGRPLLRRPGFWLTTAVAAACCLPIVVWNVQNDWVSLRHVAGQAGLTGQPSGRGLGPVRFFGEQAVLLLGFWFAAWLAAVWAHAPWRDRDDGVRYLWWMSVPTFAVFGLFSLQTKVQMNWPVTAYLAGLVLSAGWLAGQWQSPRRWYRRLLTTGTLTACGLGLGLTVFGHRAERAYPLLARLAGPATAMRPCPLREFDPTCRLRGWRTLAAEVDRLRDRLRADGAEPVLAGTSWTLPGELAFYCAGRPAVYTLGLINGDRYSQYDLWRPNPVRDPAAFAGRTFIVVGPVGPALAQGFARIDAAYEVTHRELGQPVASWGVAVCRGFRGFGELVQDRRY